MSFLDLFKRIKPRNMSPEQRIYDAAKKYLGVSEVSGKQSNPKIVAWIDQAAEWLKDGVDDIDGKIAWCGCFRGAIGFEDCDWRCGGTIQSIQLAEVGQVHHQEGPLHLAAGSNRCDVPPRRQSRRFDR
jgi:hypothetical protein